MAFSDEKEGLIFPTRTGSAGTSIENRMLENVGGVEGIRTKVVNTLDGEVTLRTRGGFPEFVLKPVKRPVPPAINRTFVFRHLDAALGVIANRFGAGLKVLVRSFSISTPNYSVSVMHSDVQGNWNDVVRLDGTIVKVNGVLSAQTVTNHGASRLPYVVGGSAPVACPDDAARSTLFTGYAEQGPIGVYQAAVAGGDAMSLAPDVAGLFDYGYGNSAGLRIDANGDFIFYGALYTTIASYYMNQVTTAWAKLRPSATAPYLTQIASGAETRYFSWTKNAGFDSVGRTSGSAYSATRSPLISDSTSGHADYPGSDLGISYDCVATGGGSDVAALFNSHQRQTSVDFSGATTCALNSTLLGQLGSATVTQSSGFTFNWTVDGGTGIVYAADAPRNSEALALSGAVKDYIYADIDEGIFLTFEVSASQNISNSAASNSQVFTMTRIRTSGAITVKYVLDIRGTKHEFVVYDGPGDALNVSTYNIDTAGAWGAPNVSFPIPIFAPTWMNQGNCPYIAYTTKAEEARGAAPEFYIDMTLMPKWKHSAVDTTGGIIKFVPNLCMFAALVTLWEQPSVFVLPFPGDLSNPSVASKFGCDLPFKVQFANGRKGVWQSQLGEGFTGYPPLEITRI